MAAGCYEMALMFFGLAAELNPMMEVTDDLLNLVKRASVLGRRNRMSRFTGLLATCQYLMKILFLCSY